MQLYLFDYESGAYCGSRQLAVTDCDPRSPDLILIPGNATRTPPPRCGVGLWPFWREGQWSVMQMIEVPDPFAQFHCE